MNQEQMQLIGKLIQKYQGRVFEIIKEVKSGVKDYESLGHKTADLVTDLLNISVKDLIC